VHVVNIYWLISRMVNGEESAVQSSSKIDGQNFLILDLAVTIVYVGVTTPCCIHIHNTGGPVPDLNFPLYGHNL